VLSVPLLHASKSLRVVPAIVTLFAKFLVPAIECTPVGVISTHEGSCVYVFLNVAQV
jgi:hypothetical protein